MVSFEPIGTNPDAYSESAGIRSVISQSGMEMAPQAAPIEEVGAGGVTRSFLKSFLKPGTWNAVGAVGNLLLGGYGLYMQNKWQKETKKEQDFWLSVKNALDAQEKQKAWKWKEDERTFARNNMLSNKFMAWADRDTAARAYYANAFRRK